VVVDLVNFQQFSMDTTTWHATIGAGTLLGDVTTRLHDAGGRAIAHGTCPQVGIGGEFFFSRRFDAPFLKKLFNAKTSGHATIGGLGPLSRQWGTALDHVIEVEVVLANSTIIRASNTSYPDVFFVSVFSFTSFSCLS
jgi:FAD/FMN-containing dehydrogenase